MPMFFFYLINPGFRAYIHPVYNNRYKTDVAAATAGPISIVCPHPLPTMPEGVLTASYFFACEALSNAAKYAIGAPVSVLLVADSELRVSVVDAGPGGARFRSGHGLAGLRERLAAFGGDIQI